MHMLRGHDSADVMRTPTKSTGVQRFEGSQALLL